MSKQAAEPKCSQKADRASAQPTSGSRGLAAMPPAYGIDFLDRPMVQREAADGRDAAADKNADQARRLNAAARESGDPLPAGLRERLQDSLGRDLSSVRIYQSGAASAAAKSIDARAYTVGQHIYFGAGNFAPHTRDGERLIAHEVAHTVQQGNATPPAAPAGLEISAGHDAAEREAHAFADSFMAGAGAPRLTPANNARIARDEVKDAVDRGDWDDAYKHYFPRSMSGMLKSAAALGDDAVSFYNNIFNRADPRTLFALDTAIDKAIAWDNPGVSDLPDDQFLECWEFLKTTQPERFKQALAHRSGCVKLLAKQLSMGNLLKAFEPLKAGAYLDKIAPLDNTPKTTAAIATIKKAVVPDEATKGLTADELAAIKAYKAGENTAASGDNKPPYDSSALKAGSSAEETAFKKKVFDTQLAGAVAAKKKFHPAIPADQLATVDNGQQMRKDAAEDCKKMLAQARADLETAKGKDDATAKATVSFGCASGYRAPSTDLMAWEGAFAQQMAATKKKRDDCADGEYGDEALKIMVGKMVAYKAVPGTSNHTNGVAMDFKVTIKNAADKDVTLSTNSSENLAWKQTWFWAWLNENAATYNFKPLATEAWHWDWKP
ncbi:MAG: DUF4157 domain-containing protein [Rhodocyclaceae bacterium]|nr:DUF4157 domain-containing protein [Rhodocyclaceae bacterium]